MKLAGAFWRRLLRDLVRQILAHDPHHSWVPTNSAETFCNMPRGKFMVVVHRADMRSATGKSHVIPICVKTPMRTTNIVALIGGNDSFDLGRLVWVGIIRHHYFPWLNRLFAQRFQGALEARRSVPGYQSNT